VVVVQMIGLRDVHKIVLSIAYYFVTLYDQYKTI